MSLYRPLLATSATVTTTTTTVTPSKVDFKSPSSTSPPPSSSSSSFNSNSSSSSASLVTVLVPPPVRPFSQFGSTTAKLLTDHYTFDQQKFRIIATAKDRIPYTVEYGFIANPTNGSLAPNSTAAATGSTKSSHSPSFSMNGYLFGSYAGPQLSYQYIGYTNPNTGDSTYWDYRRPFGIGGLTLKATAKSVDANYNNQSNVSAGLDYIRDQFHFATNIVSDGRTHHLEASASVKATQGLSIGGNAVVKAVTPLSNQLVNFSLSRYNVGFEQEYGNWLISAYSSPSFTPALNSTDTLLETNFNKLNLGLTKVVTDRHTISALGEVVLKDPAVTGGTLSMPSRSLTLGSTFKFNPSSLVKGKIHMPSGVLSLAVENRFVSPKLTFGMAIQTDPLNTRLTAWGLNMAFGEY